MKKQTIIGAVLIAAFSAVSSVALVDHLRTPPPAKQAVRYTKGLDQGIYVERPRIGGKLYLTLFKKDPKIPGKFRSYFYGPHKNLIVNAGEAFLVDAWQNLVELENMKFHGIGTGSTAAAEGNTGCETELTTVYNPDNTRATGSLTEASASVFRTVGTNTVDGSAAITEWCLLSQAATGGGTMWSRVVFSAINLANGDSLQTTYDLTVE